MSIKVGDTLWNNDYFGRRKWHEDVIVGETSQSWLVGDLKFKPHRISKKTLLESKGKYGDTRWFTAEQKERYEWENTHRRYIAMMVEAASYEMLKQIASLVGYDETKA